jgi:hypothetical protein
MDASAKTSLEKAKRGPKTEAGKIVAAQNSTKHGILSPKPVVLAFESDYSWRTHRQSVLDSLDPQDGIEQILAERVAFNSWRLNRVIVYETETIADAQENIVPEMRKKAEKYPPLYAGEYADLDAASKAQEKRAVYEDLVGLLREEIDELSSRHTMAWVSWEAPYYAVEFAESQKAGEDFDYDGLNDHAISQIADDLETRFNERLGDAALPPVAELREALKWLATAAGIEDDEHYTAYESLMEEICTVAEQHRDQAESTAEDASRELLSQRRREILPSEEKLKTISRYEAHLSREMYKALHELEAMKARGRGETTPLARVDVDVRG